MGTVADLRPKSSTESEKAKEMQCDNSLMIAP